MEVMGRWLMMLREYVLKTVNDERAFALASIERSGVDVDYIRARACIDEISILSS